MKTILSLFFLHIPFLFWAQQNLPTIKATTQIATITEGDMKLNWYLSSENQPDIYEIVKGKENKSIALYTDIDSIKVELKPGESFDFIVLWNGDSCYNRFVYPAPITTYIEQFPATHDTIPFVLTANNNINMPVLLNGSDSLWLMFDTGAIGLKIVLDSIQKKTNLLAQHGEPAEKPAIPSYHSSIENNTLQIGALTWEKQAIRVGRLSGQSTDGVFDWDLFDGRLVEIDFDKNWFIVHSSLPAPPEGFTAFNMQFIFDYISIRGNLVVDNQAFSSSFLLNSGYQKTIFLDSVLLKKLNFPSDLEVIKTNSIRDGNGTVFTTRIVNLDALTFGELSLANIPVQIINTPNPAGFPTHFLGNEVMKRYNRIFDFQENVLYLKPNSLVSVPYRDAK